MGHLRAGAPVNLERAVTPATRLGGHIVQGHVDARGRFLSATEHGGSWTVRIAYPPEMARYLVFKGSVAVEGISLTVAALADEYFDIAVIPKTWAVTNLSHLRPDAPVNLEADIIAKYVERILSLGPPTKTETPRSPWKSWPTWAISKHLKLTNTLFIFRKHCGPKPQRRRGHFTRRVWIWLELLY